MRGDQAHGTMTGSGAGGAPGAQAASLGEHHASVAVPAAGSTNAALRIAPARMAELVGAEWIDVCDRPPQGSAA